MQSVNPAFDDMEVLRDEIRDLMFVQAVLHFDVRM